MGGGSSGPRKITIENPDGPAIIKITKNVTDRLQTGNQQQDDMREKSTATATVVDRPSANLAGKVPSDGAETTVYITSHQIHKQVEDVITKNNIYWENRLKTLRDGYRRINAELENEYNKAVAEVNQSLGVEVTGKSDLVACKQSQSSVIECYKANRHQPLLCSDEVLKFNECVTHNMNAALQVN